MAIAKKAVKKSSEWEVVSADSVDIPPRTREMSGSTKEILEKVKALKPGQALRVPDRYTITRDVNGSEIKSIKCYMTLKRHVPNIKAKKDVNGDLWVFRLEEQTENQTEE
jgi:hypothetical protein